MGKRKSNGASGIATFLVLCLVSLVLFTVYVREPDCTPASEGNCGPLHTVQLGAAEVLSPLRGLFAAVADPVGDTGRRVWGNLDAQEEEDLREEAMENEALASQASRLQRENDRLRGLLEGERSAYEYGPLAEVTGPAHGQLSDRLVINVGTDDGIRPQMPVVVGNNTLIGRTTEQVSRHTAEVMLVTDPNFAAGVRIVPPAEFDPASGELNAEVADEESSYGEGILRTSWERYLAVEYVDLSARAEQGDFVVTSGRAGGRELLFPPGLLVGAVESVGSEDINQYKNIVVAPAERPDDLEEVRVVVGW